MTDDMDTEESRQGWLNHQHTKKRVVAQRKEVEALGNYLQRAAGASTDPDVRDAAAKLMCAQRFLAVLEGKDE